MRKMPILVTIYAALAGVMLPAFAAADQFVKEDGSYRTIGEALASEKLEQVRALKAAANV